MNTIPVAALNLDVDALVNEPREPWAAYAFAHGAGAGMEHVFMQAITERMIGRGIAVVRYQFPYMQKRLAEGKRWGRPDPATRLEATVGAAVRWSAERFSGLPLFAGGKSLGGRMTSRWAATVGSVPEALAGLIFFGFPLHAAGKPGVERGEHLADAALPMLFLQGDRDKMADQQVLQALVQGLGKRARLRVVAGADHGFHVLKRSGRSNEEVLDEIAGAAAKWIAEIG